MTDVRSQRTEVRCQKTEDRSQKTDDKKQMTEDRRQMSEEFEVGSRTHRRPIGLDYAAAKDAEGGKKEGGKLGR